MIHAVTGKHLGLQSTTIFYLTHLELLFKIGYVCEIPKILNLQSKYSVMILIVLMRLIKWTIFCHNRHNNRHSVCHECELV